jgi:hypothetical protein
MVFQEQLLLKNFRPEWLVSRPNHAITPLSMIQLTAFTLSLPWNNFVPLMESTETYVPYDSQSSHFSFVLDG